jgi:hypothetical protein
LSAYVQQGKMPELEARAEPFDDQVVSVVDNLRIIPLVKVREPEEAWKFWDGIPVRRIAIDYISLQRRPALYSRALSAGIHSALEFDGEVTAVPVGKDWDLDNLDVERYATDVQSMGFNSIMTPDDYTYLKDRPDYRMHRILTAIAKARKVMETVREIEVIGTVKGTVTAEICFNVERLVAEGLASLAFPCSEFIEARRFTEPQFFVRLCLEGGVLPWLIGANSIRAMRKLGAHRYSASAWCYGALCGMVYGENRWESVGDRFWCRHDACKRDRDAYPSYAVRARHNIRRLLEEDRLLGLGREIGEL